MYGEDKNKIIIFNIYIFIKLGNNMIPYWFNIYTNVIDDLKKKNRNVGTLGGIPIII